MGTPSIKSHQYALEMYRGGKKIIIDTITNVSVNQDADFSRSQYVGNPIGEGDTTYNGNSGSLDMEVKGPEADDLLQAIVTENYNGVGITDVALLETENYSNGVVATWLHLGVQLKMSKTAQGNSKVTKRIDFQSDFVKRI